MSYFDNTKKGELKDISTDLNNLDLKVKKDAVKKIIAFMTVGKDVSSLYQ